MCTKNKFWLLAYIFSIFIVSIIIGCNEDNGLNTPQAPTNSNSQLLINDPDAAPTTKKSNFDIDQPPPGENYNFYLRYPTNYAWAELGTSFSWTKLNNIPPGQSFFRYDVQLSKDGTTYHRYATPYYNTNSTSASISGIPQGTYSWTVLAEYSQQGYGQFAQNQWSVKLYDVNIKGPSSAVPLSNQVWYVDEYSNFGPYTYQWKVYNNNGQTVCGPFSTTTLSASQIPGVAYGIYWIDLYVTFDAGTKHKTKQVIMD